MAFPDYPPTVPTFLGELVRRFGERPAIVDETRRLTYAELEALSAQVARNLLAAGVSKGTRVGLLLPNGSNWLISFLAVTRIGAIAVPLNTFYQARELGWALQHADLHTLLTQGRLGNHDYLERLESCVPGLADLTHASLLLRSMPYLRQIYVWGDCDRKWARSGSDLEAALEAEDGEIDEIFLKEVESRVTPADAMMIIYSSGSTSDPKGAIHSHGAVIRHSYQLAMLRDMTEEDRIWSPMPFFWIGAYELTNSGSYITPEILA